MVTRREEYLPLNYLNALAEKVPLLNRLRRVERCELNCDKYVEVHCLRFDILLGCASYVTSPHDNEMLHTVDKTLNQMIKGESSLLV